MKTYYTLSLAALLALASCGTAYQTGQTPDAVYFSPGEEAQPAAASDQYTDDQYYDDQYAVAEDSDEGNYVVYQDGDYDEDYDYANGGDGYYSRRIQMFDQPGSLYSYNYYNLGSPWYTPYYGGSYLWNRFAYSGFGWYSNPWMWSPGLHFGLGWGSPYAFGGWYSSWYNPWYSYGYYPGYYSGWGWGGKYGYTNPRPAVSYQPRRSFGSPASQTTRRAVSNGSTSTTERPRRVFSSSPSERVRTADDSRARRSSGTRTSVRTTDQGTRRTFQRESSERPVRVSRDNNTRTRTSTRQPARRTYQAPSRPTQQRTAPTRSYQPTRSVSRPSISTRSSAPARTSSPRRR